jgi:DNA-binding CsgD family transcriptional regulator
MSTRLDLISTGVSLAALWRDLVDGTYTISATLFTPQDCTLVLSASNRMSGAEREVLGARHVEILERALLACPKKVIASDLLCSPSSVAAALQRCFAFMGLSCTPSQVPLPVVIAAYANRARSSEPLSRELSLPSSPPREKVVQLRRPECDLNGFLPPAEEAIVRLLAEGKSYREMASTRLTSVRTIANQVASVFRRLGVSGRPELLCHLAERALLPDSTLPLRKAPHSMDPWQRLTIASSTELK